MLDAHWIKERFSVKNTHYLSRIEESAQTLIVLHVGGLKEPLKVRDAHTYLLLSPADT